MIREREDYTGVSTRDVKRKAARYMLICPKITNGQEQHPPFITPSKHYLVSRFGRQYEQHIADMLGQNLVFVVRI